MTRNEAMKHYIHNYNESQLRMEQAVSDLYLVQDRVYGWFQWLIIAMAAMLILYVIIYYAKTRTKYADATSDESGGPEDYRIYS